MRRWGWVEQDMPIIVSGAVRLRGMYPMPELPPLAFRYASALLPNQDPSSSSLSASSSDVTSWNPEAVRCRLLALDIPELTWIIPYASVRRGLAASVG